MFWRNIQYKNFEKKCKCCRKESTTEYLIKNKLYFNGSKYICEDCFHLMERIGHSYIEKYGKISSSDYLYLSGILPKLLDNHTKILKYFEQDDK